MTAPELDLLGYLHDAIVHELSWSYYDEAHHLKLVVACHDDSGYPAWDGKILVVIFHDVIRASLDLLGHVVGSDSIDAFRQGLSPALAEHLSRGESAGLAVPKLALRVSLHSGSALHIAFETLSIEVRES